jgi:GAF domain-containing protein
LRAGGVAIDDAEHLQQLNKKLNEFGALYKLATNLTTIDNSRDMTEMIYQMLKKIMDVDFAVWLSWQERTETLMVNYWEGLGKSEAITLLGRELSMKDKTVYSSSVRARVIRTYIEEIPYFKEKAKTLTTVPIITKGSLHGVFCLGSRREHAFSPNDINIASIVASQATSDEQQQALLNATRLMTIKMMSEIAHDLKKPLTHSRSLRLCGSAGGNSAVG